MILDGISHPKGEDYFFLDGKIFLDDCQGVGDRVGKVYWEVIA